MNPLETIADDGPKELTEVAKRYNLIDIEVPTEKEPTELILERLVEALEFIGPYTMDDSAKFNALQQLIAGMTLIDQVRDSDDSFRLRGREPHRRGQGRGPHYDPLGELDELDERTIEALGNRYNVAEVIDFDTQADSLVFRSQFHLASGLLELSGAHFSTEDQAVRAILAAMLLVDRLHDDSTVLEVETVQDTFRMPPTDEHPDGEEVEFENLQLSLHFAKAQ